jgi:hypothetical protein
MTSHSGIIPAPSKDEAVRYEGSDWQPNHVAPNGSARRKQLIERYTL